MQQAAHWADENVLGSKAHFYYDGNPPALRIRDIKRGDAGLYRCRVDFQKSPTRNWRINLTVLGKSPLHITIHYLFYPFHLIHHSSIFSYFHSTHIDELFYKCHNPRILLFKLVVKMIKMPKFQCEYGFEILITRIYSLAFIPGVKPWRPERMSHLVSVRRHSLRQLSFQLLFLIRDNLFPLFLLQ